MHDRALGREQVGERVAHGHPTATAGVQRAGGVGGHELEVDAQAVERVAVAVRLALRHDREQDLVQPARGEAEVEEAGARDLDPLEVRGPGPLELVGELGGDLPRRQAERLGQLEGDVGGEVAVSRSPSGTSARCHRGRGEAARVERGVDCGGELVTDHEGWRRRPAPFAARRARAW